MKKLLSLALLTCIVLLGTSRLAHAEWIPPFNLDAWADQSPLIVEAVIDTTGELSEARAIKGDYDLRSESGRKAWFQAYNQADPAARRILIRLWSFENKINQPALIRAAPSPHPSLTVNPFPTQNRLLRPPIALQ